MSQQPLVCPAVITETDITLALTEVAFAHEAPDSLQLTGAGVPGLCLDLSRGQDFRQATGWRISRACLEALGYPSDLQGVQAHLVAGGQSHNLMLQVHKPRAASLCEGHFAGIDPDGHLTGWGSDTGDAAREVVIDISIGSFRAFLVTKGSWYNSTKRRFGMALSNIGLEPGRFHPVSASIGLDGPHLNRSPFYIGRFDGKWIMAAPLRQDGTVLTGVFQIAGHAMTQVSVHLRGSGATATCSLPTAYNFNNLAAGFRLELPPGITAADAVIELHHERLTQPIMIAAGDLP